MKRIIFALLVLVLCAQCTPETDLITLEAEASFSYTEVTEETIDDGEVISRNNNNSADLTLNLGLSNLHPSLASQIDYIKIDTETTNCINFTWNVGLSPSDNAVLEPLTSNCPPPNNCPGIVIIQDVLTGGCDTEKIVLGQNFRSIKDIKGIKIVLNSGRIIPVNLRITRFIVY